MAEDYFEGRGWVRYPGETVAEFIDRYAKRVIINIGGRTMVDRPASDYLVGEPGIEESFQKVPVVPRPKKTERLM